MLSKINNAFSRKVIRMKSMEAIKDKKEFFLLVLTVLGIVLGLWNSLAILVLFVIHFIYILITPKGETLAFLLFLLPFATIYKFAPGTMSLFTVLEVLAVGKCIFKRLSIDKNLLIGVLLFIFSLFFAPTFDAINTIKALLIILILYYFLMKDSYDMKKCVLFFTYGLLISSILGLLRDQLPMIKTYISEVSHIISFEQTRRFTGLFSDPNYYSVCVVACMFSLLSLYKKQLIGISLGVYLTILSILGLLTFSKSFVIMFVIFLIILVMSLPGKNKVIFSILAVAIALVLVWMLLYSNISLFILIRSRFSVSGLDDLTTGRMSLFSRYLEYILNNIRTLIIGEGLGAELLYANGRLMASHNTLLDFIYYHGLIGTCLYISLICGVLIKHRIRFKRTTNNYITLFCIMAMYCFLSAYFVSEFPFVLLLGFMVYNTPLTSTLESDNNLERSE